MEFVQEYPWHKIDDCDSIMNLVHFDNWLLLQVKSTSFALMPKILRYLWWELGLIFFLDTILNASPKPHLQEVLPCRHPCHTWDPV